LAPPKPKGQVVIFNLPSSTPLVIAARFTLRNEGGTATSNGRVVLSCKKVAYADSAHQQEPFSLFRWEQDGPAVSEMIGPKQSIEVGPYEISNDEGEVLNAQMGIIRIFCMGEIRYWDRVVPWPFAREHITQFAQQLIVTDFDPKTMVVKAKTRSVGRHNCADNCPRE
jgi:hypothetical protein